MITVEVRRSLILGVFVKITGKAPAWPLCGLKNGIGKRDRLPPIPRARQARLSLSSCLILS